MTWLIGYKDSEETIGEMLVSVDQCSPREHYLYLYNEIEGEVDVEGDIAAVGPEKLARILGSFAPGGWLYALNTDILEAVVVPEDEATATE